MSVEHHKKKLQLSTDANDINNCYYPRTFVYRLLDLRKIIQRFNLEHPFYSYVYLHTIKDPINFRQQIQIPI